MRIYNAASSSSIENVDIPANNESSAAITKRVAALESKISQLSEQVKRLSNALEINKRDIRRQGSSISSISSVVSSQLN